MTEKLITIAKLTNPAEAQIIRSRLEAEGIFCHIPDENVRGMMNPIYAIARGLVRIQVKESDAKRAKEILEQKERE